MGGGIVGWLNSFSGRSTPLPPPALAIATTIEDDPEAVVPEPAREGSHSISGFVCIIEYDGELRMITCRRYDRIGEIAYVGGLCQTASAYRQFRSDRISTVFDAYTGEVLGDGEFFTQFALDGVRERAPTWDLIPSRRYTLLCGLKILAFMARCDGHWHPLESEAIERFVCSTWLHKEWPGDPPMGAIVAHAQCLSPDVDTFFRAIAHFATNAKAGHLIRRAVVDLIEADGVINDDEDRWARELEMAFDEASGRTEAEFLVMLQRDGILPS